MNYKSIPYTVIAALVLVLVFFLGLEIGLLVKPNNPTPIIIDKNVKIGLSNRSDLTGQKTELSGNFVGGNFVASINGKAYYPKGCKSANIIKEENKIWFESAEEAEADGYAPAKNCP